jgi:hypothetical protein
MMRQEEKMLRSLLRILLPAPEKELTITKRRSRSTKGTVKKEKDQRHLQDRHCAL